MACSHVTRTHFTSCSLHLLFIALFGQVRGALSICPSNVQVSTRNRIERKWPLQKGIAIKSLNNLKLTAPHGLGNRSVSPDYSSHTKVHLHTVSNSGDPSPEAVLNTLQDLWGDVVGCAAEGGGGVSWTDAFLAHAIVSELDVSFMVQQNIVQLEVSVNDAWKEMKGINVSICILYLFSFTDNSDRIPYPVKMPKCAFISNLFTPE